MVHEYQFKNTVYRIASLYENDVVVLQASFLPELRKLGQDVLSPYKMTEQVRVNSLLTIVMAADGV